MLQKPNLSNIFCRIITWFDSPKSPHLGRIWILFWIYPVIVAVFVQFIALPYIFPEWHAGGGTLLQGDSTKMHFRAVNLAQDISDQGWHVWELKPGRGDMAPIGIAASIYTLTTPELWTLIPLNAAMHATAALLLLIIINQLLRDWRIAFVTVLPFWLYPSAMNWYTQIHKDGFAIAGIYLFLYGWIKLTQEKPIEKNYRRISLSIIWIVVGFILTWIMRRYLSIAMLSFCISIILFLVLGYWIGSLKNTNSRYIFLSIIFLSLFLAYKPSLPLTNKILSPIFYHRNYFVSKGGLSNYDETVRFETVGDILSYIPRATQIAVFAPFPELWFGQGNEPQTTIMRRVVGIEMVGIYISILGLPISIWRWWRKIEFWVPFTFSISMAVLYSLVVNNMGALYRYRYGFTMILVALGVSGWITLWQRWKKHREL